MMADTPNVAVYKYSTIASYMLERFMDDQEDSIIREGDNIVFARNYETRFLVKAFTDYINDFFNDYDDHPYGKSKTIVVGTCYTHHNWMSKHIKEISSDMTKKFVRSKIPVRYAFSDRNFIADESLINQLLDTLVGKLIRRDITVYTPNHNQVNFVFVKDVSESHIVSVIKGFHGASNCFVYPTSKTEILFDVNRMVYKDLRKKYRVNSEIREKVLYMYQLACSPEEDE
jgi:hypothetical protein